MYYNHGSLFFITTFFLETPNNANKFTKEAIQLTESVQELKKSFGNKYITIALKCYNVNKFTENLSRSNSQEQNPESVENLRTVVVPVSSHSSAVTVQRKKYYSFLKILPTRKLL